MKKKIKNLFVLIFCLFALTGCTTNFCSPTDVANIKNGILQKIESNDPNYTQPSINQLSKAGVNTEGLTEENPWNQLNDGQKGQYVDYLYNQNHPKACLVTEEHTDLNSGGVIERKTFGYAAKQGLLEMLAFPFSFLIVNCATVLGGGQITGISTLFAIVIVTFLVKGLVMLLTLKSTRQSQKIQRMQPEMDAINDKYANRFDDQSKQQKSMELMKLYKKYNVNPASALLAPFLTLPIFIAFYCAIKDSTVLYEGYIGGLAFGDKLGSCITSGSILAIILFVVMGGIQFVTMKLPQWIAKKNVKAYKQKKKQGMNQSEFISYFFLVMILVIGWILPVGMSLYWIASSVFQVGQTFLMNYLDKKEA